MLVFGTRPEAIKMAPVYQALGRDRGVFEPLCCVTAQHRTMLDQVLDSFRITPDIDLDLMRDRQSPAELGGAVMVRVAAVLHQHRPDLDPQSIMVTGNTVVDALQGALRRLDHDPGLLAGASDYLARVIGHDWQSARTVVVTCHRRESLAGGLEEICGALKKLAGEFPKVRFVCPVHANPAVRQTAYRLLMGYDNIVLVDPLPYLPFLHLLRHCHLVLTDSGGLQEEGPTLGKPVLVMRAVTERPEAVAAGGVRLVGVQSATIVAGVSELLANPQSHAAMARAPHPFGDGAAAGRIARFVKLAL